MAAGEIHENIRNNRSILVWRLIRQLQENPGTAKQNLELLTPQGNSLRYQRFTATNEREHT